MIGAVEKAKEGPRNYVCVDKQLWVLLGVIMFVKNATKPKTTRAILVEEYG